MRVFGRAEGYEPRGTRYVRSLGYQLHGAVLRIFPESLCPVDRSFLDGAVGAVGRVRAAKADERFGDQRRGGVLEGVALEIHSAVIEAEQRLLASLDFRSHNGCSRVNH